MILMLENNKFVCFCILVLRLTSNQQETNYSKDVLYKKYPDYGKKWIFFPNGKEIPTVGYLQMASDNFSLANLSFHEVEKAVSFRLYTRIYKSGRVLSLNNTEHIKTHFDVNKKTKFVIHGWLSSGNSDTCIFIKDAYLFMHDVNVVIVDWSQIADNIFYPIPMAHTKDVGYFYSRFINHLISLGAKPNDMHLIGHSLGAHISGFAGRMISYGRLARITGLDPALPGFSYEFNIDHLLPSDADFVDIIHTSGGVLGFLENLGHADFFPNGGIPPQPGCMGPAEVIEACSHGRSWKYFAESIMNKGKFTSYTCTSWSDFLNNLCKNSLLIVPMGEPAPKNTKGNFYLRTGSSPPYAQETSKVNYIKHNDIST